jgi:DNA-binding PadR family transcriptional regulator
MLKFLSRPEEIILFTILKLREDAYCVPIREMASKISGKDWSFGAVYVPLNRLEKKGFVKSSFDDPTPIRGGRSRRIYQITGAGMKALAEVRELQANMWAETPEFSHE